MPVMTQVRLQGTLKCKEQRRERLEAYPTGGTLLPKSNSIASIDRERRIRLSNGTYYMM
jgi:hypothetical protein